METPIINILEKALAEKKEYFDEIIYMLADGQLSFIKSDKEIMVEDLRDELETIDKFRKQRLLSEMYKSIMAIDDKKFMIEFGQMDFPAFLYLAGLFPKGQQESLIDRLYHVIDKQYSGKANRKKTTPAERAELLIEIEKSFDERAIRRGEISREEVEKADMELRQETKTLVEMAALAEKRGATRQQAVSAVTDYLFRKDGIDPNSEQAKSYLKLIFGDEYDESGV